MIFGRVLALLLLVVFGRLDAEPDGRLSGVILDASLASVPDALVTVVNEDSGLRRITTTQPDGTYVVSSLQPGSYKVTIRKPGFRTMIRFGVKLTESQPARADFKLIIGSVQETITVEGSAPLFNTEEASVSTVMGRDEVEHLPIDGSGLLGLIGLVPGAVITPATRGEAGQFTVDGQRPNTHYFTVDGASANTGVSGGGSPAQANGGALPGMTAFGSLDSMLTPDAMQEMRVQTSTSTPQFGRMPGAQVSLTSRAGSNQFHGSLLYGFRNEALDANDWFANRDGDPRAPLRLQDYSAGLGGPLWRNHTFFFISYEGMRLQQPFIWVQPVPDLAVRKDSFPWANPLLNLFPVPNGPELGGGLALWTGRTSRPARLDAGAIRLDHAFTSWLTAFVRYNEAPSSTQFGTSPVNTLDLTSRAITVGFDVRVKPNLFVDLRLNYADASSTSVWNQPGVAPGSCDLEPTTFQFLHVVGVCDYLVRFSVAGVGQVVSGSEGVRAQTQFQATPAANWNIGTHAIRFGADYRRLAPARTDATGNIYAFVNSVQDLTNNGHFFQSCGTQQLPCATFPQFASAILREASLFAQDTWRLSRRLTLTYGLRWEISPPPLPGHGATANFFQTAPGASAAAKQPIWKTTNANFAPRVGFALQPVEGGRTVIRAGLGVYYDSSLSLAGDLVSGGPLTVSTFSSSVGLANTLLQFGFTPQLRLPAVKQWNISVERAFSAHDVVTFGYVGSSGSDLIRRELSGSFFKGNFLALATNDGASIYHALQAQYQRRLSHGLQGLISYAWSHSIDNSSTDSGLYAFNSEAFISQDRASSDYDVRHSLSAGITYELPHSIHNAFIRDWELDGTFRARTGFPINVLDSDEFNGITLLNAYRPNFIGGVPVWITDPSAPGGRRINPAAFQVLPPDPLGNGTQGNLGRNALTGFGMTQFDLAVQRDFLVKEQRSLQIRMEAYNALNHSNFANPIPFLSSPLFGQSNSMLNLMLGTGSPGSGLAPIFQSGGARSVRFVVRFRF
ncbi:MAG TPA: TonB-dependent receptor [Bryobacteraceae bacterium]|nr:TonB-dependent receptor [Bryobacteraceae bacterium]